MKEKAKLKKCFENFCNRKQIKWKKMKERGKNKQVGCRVYGRLSQEGPRPMGGMPSLRVFLRDPSPYLREFRRKSRKTPNGLVDKPIDQGLNLALPVFQFRALPLRHWWSGLQVLDQLSACGTWAYRRRALRRGISKGS